MTTIAYRDGVMATDTLAVGGDLYRGKVRKIQRLEDGSLLGIAGDAGYHCFFEKWLLNKPTWENRPRLPENSDISLLFVRRDGRIFHSAERLVLVEVETEFIAIGSGGDLAMGAMGAGSTARQAVEIAARFDCFTGGNIDEFRLSAPRQPKKRISFPPDCEAAFS